MEALERRPARRRRVTAVHQVAVGRRALRRRERPGARVAAAAGRARATAARTTPAAGRPAARAATSSRSSGCEPAPDDLLVIRYSAYVAAALGGCWSCPERKLLVYHNVTPAGLPLEPPARAWRCSCARGPRAAAGVRAQRPTWRPPTRSSTRGELRAAGASEVRVVPILFDPARLEPTRGRAPEGDGPLVLVVGRLAPNKRHDLVIARLRRLPARARARRAAAVRGRAARRRPTRELMRALAAGPGARRHARRRPVPARAERRLRRGRRDAVDVRARGLLRAAARGVPLRRCRWWRAPPGAMPEVGGDAVLWDRRRRPGGDGRADRTWR